MAPGAGQKSGLLSRVERPCRIWQSSLALVGRHWMMGGGKQDRQDGCIYAEWSGAKWEAGRLQFTLGWVHESPPGGDGGAGAHTSLHRPTPVTIPLRHAFPRAAARSAQINMGVSSGPVPAPAPPPTLPTSSQAPPTVAPAPPFQPQMDSRLSRPAEPSLAVPSQADVHPTVGPTATYPVDN